MKSEYLTIPKNVTTTLFQKVLYENSHKKEVILLDDLFITYTAQFKHLSF